MLIYSFTYCKQCNYQKKLAICKCAAHTSNTDTVSKGNAFADQIAKKAALGEIKVLHITEDKLNSDILQDMQQQSPNQEQKTMEKKRGYIKKQHLCMTRTKAYPSKESVQMGSHIEPW